MVQQLKDKFLHNQIPPDMGPATPQGRKRKAAVDNGLSPMKPGVAAKRVNGCRPVDFGKPKPMDTKLKAATQKTPADAATSEENQNQKTQTKNKKRPAVAEGEDPKRQKAPDVSQDDDPLDIEDLDDEKLPGRTTRTVHTRVKKRELKIGDKKIQAVRMYLSRIGLNYKLFQRMHHRPMSHWCC